MWNNHAATQEKLQTKVESEATGNIQVSIQSFARRDDCSSYINHNLNRQKKVLGDIHPSEDLTKMPKLEHRKLAQTNDNSLNAA